MSTTRVTITIEVRGTMDSDHIAPLVASAAQEVVNRHDFRSGNLSGNNLSLVRFGIDFNRIVVTADVEVENE